MKKHLKKFLICIFLSFLFFVFYTANAQKPLEVDYINFSSKFLNKDLLPKYVLYFFTFIISISGIIAFGSLVYAGIIYLLSRGKPEMLKKARSRLASVFFGIILLLSSYILLNNINSRLTKLQLPEIKEEKVSFSLPSIPPSTPPDYQNYLWRITEIANSSQSVLEKMKTAAEQIKSLTSWCDCKNTVPLCLCKKYIGGSCGALFCYSSGPNQPCPNEEEIKKNQQELIALTYEIIYYKNRAIHEREDFLLEIENLKKLSDFFSKKLEEKRKEQPVGATKEFYEEYLKLLETQKNNTEKKVSLYSDLEKELKKFSDLIINLSVSSERLSKLPDGIKQENILGCLENVKQKCQGSCKGGCHDTKGCEPVRCQGGNPCPINEIESEKKKVLNISEDIINTAEKIKNIVNEIIHIL